jgi:hypothetical protein
MLIRWNIFEITTITTPIHGAMLRGKLRKLSLELNFPFLVENATDKENCVRFAVSSQEDAEKIILYLKSKITDVEISKIAQEIINPVLSKMKVNTESRYTL